MDIALVRWPYTKNILSQGHSQSRGLAERGQEEEEENEQH